jgi:hypothetical protein
MTWWINHIVCSNMPAATGGVAAQTYRAPYQKNRLQIALQLAGRAGDDLQNLGGRGTHCVRASAQAQRQIEHESDTAVPQELQH